MKISFMPKTPMGKWSGRLIIIFLIIFAFVQLLVVSGQRGGNTFFDNLVLSIPIFIAGIVGIVASIIGIVSIIKSRERSVVVFAASAIGLLIMIFLLGEIIFSH